MRNPLARIPACASAAALTTFVIALTGACDATDFTDREMTLTSRGVQVTVENRTPQTFALLFASDTLHGQERIPPSVTATFTYDPAPREDRPGRLPLPPESWSLVLGEAVLGPHGEMLGVGGRLRTVARSEAPFDTDVGSLYIRIDANGARWRVIAP